MYDIAPYIKGPHMRVAEIRLGIYIFEVYYLVKYDKRMQ